MQPDEKRAHVKAWQSSGLTKTAYARKQGINDKTFGRWCRLYQQDTSKMPGLASVAVLPVDVSSDQTAIQLQLRSGCVLALPHDISPRWLGELLQCLG